MMKIKDRKHFFYGTNKVQIVSAEAEITLLAEESITHITIKYCRVYDACNLDHIVGLNILMRA